MHSKGLRIAREREQHQGINGASMKIAFLLWALGPVASYFNNLGFVPCLICSAENVTYCIFGAATPLKLRNDARPFAMYDASPPSL
mmetsp:Transcript_38446/g.57179  ORF Transcript_38446/g.57179 Transcript_38446/m.57179 type:complete len:86 (-) Transcript_38446:779-1036(-)